MVEGAAAIACRIRQVPATGAQGRRQSLQGRRGAGAEAIVEGARAVAHAIAGYPPCTGLVSSLECLLVKAACSPCARMSVCLHGTRTLGHDFLAREPP